jgi:hypothetical protein
MSTKESYFSLGSASLRGTAKAVAVGGATGLLGGYAAEYLASAPLGYGATAAGASFLVEEVEATGHRWLGDSGEALPAPAPQPVLTSSEQLQLQLQQQSLQLQATQAAEARAAAEKQQQQMTAMVTAGLAAVAPLMANVNLSGVDINADVMKAARKAAKSFLGDLLK